MTVESFVAAILPSLCVSIIMVFFNRNQNKRDKREVECEKQKKKSEQTQLSLLLATAKLSYATAMAMKNGHPNGEIEDGIEQYKEAMTSFKQFERELIVEKVYEK